MNRPPPEYLLMPLLGALDESAIVAVTDTAGRITYVNDRCCQVSGYDREELIGADHRLLNSGEHPPEFFRDMYRVIADGKVWRGTIRNRRKSGVFYWVDTTITPSLGADGRPRAYVAIRVDVTQHIHAQQELQAARAAAERATVARERFLANLSHELRTPLTTVIGFAEVLARTALRTDQRESVAVIRDSADAMRRLINDVLTLAQSQTDGAALAPRATDLRALVQGCLDGVSARAAEKG
jgi:PAS domain S-box-containing protein